MPGPLGSSGGSGPIDTGTMARRASPRPGGTGMTPPAAPYPAFAPPLFDGPTTRFSRDGREFEIQGPVPADDGECNVYHVRPYDTSLFYPQKSLDGTERVRTREPRKDPPYPVIFVNGQSGNPKKHQFQARNFDRERRTGNWHLQCESGPRCAHSGRFTALPAA